MDVTMKVTQQEVVMRAGGASLHIERLWEGECNVTVWAPGGKPYRSFELDDRIIGCLLQLQELVQQEEAE